jgi:phage terminase large subunit-like protein
MQPTPTPTRLPSSTSKRDTYPHWIYDGSEIPDPFGFGDRAVRFLKALKHPKSVLPMRQFQLDPWMERIVRRIYGPRDAAGGRIVKTVVLLVPRGNRKTTFASGLALLHTIGPERVSLGEAIFAARTREQASRAFREAYGIVETSIRDESKVKAFDPHNAPKKLVHEGSRASLSVISSDAASQHGATPNFVLADELHVWPNRLLWEALTTGLDKVDDSLLVVTTTAGKGQENAAWEIVEDARKIASGEEEDESVLPVLFEASKDVDWRDEAAWHRVNPGLVHGYPALSGFRRHAKRAERSMPERQSFLQLKLNVWSEASNSPFIDMSLWDACKAPIDWTTFGPDDQCWIGVDMAVSFDLAAVVACFRRDDCYYLRPFLFTQEDALREREESQGFPFTAWVEEGHLIATPGNIIDHGAIEAKIRELCALFAVAEIGFDRAYAQDVQGPLLADGLPVVTIGQGWVTQSPALVTLERAILAGNLRHDGNPVLRWNFANVHIATDHAGNRTLHKGKSTGRIDGAAATWMSVSRASAFTSGNWLESVDMDDFLKQAGLA